MTSVTPPESSMPHARASALPPAASAYARPLDPMTAARLEASYGTLEAIRLPNGLYLASPSADYSKVWLRDTVYESLPYVDKRTSHYERTYWSLLDILRRHEWKIDAILRQKPADRDAYIHARFHPETLREFSEPWGNKQNDATGAILFGVAQGLRHGKRILRDERDERLVRKLIHMHGALCYWEDADNGMWEEAEEVHASSIGAALGGLTAIREQGFDVPQEYIDRGRQALDALLPRESITKRADLALLSLAWPYRVLTADQRRKVVHNVEKYLLRERGVIRYEGDSYYSPLAEEHGRDKPWEFYHGSEAEWTFGLPWLSLIHRDMGNPQKADEYLERTAQVEQGLGCLPELYYARTDMPNPNTPLGWSVAMHILALEARLRAK